MGRAEGRIPAARVTPSTTGQHPAARPPRAVPRARRGPRSERPRSHLFRYAFAPGDPLRHYGRWGSVAVPVRRLRLRRRVSGAQPLRVRRSGTRPHQGDGGAEGGPPVPPLLDDGSKLAGSRSSWGSPAQKRPRATGRTPASRAARARRPSTCETNPTTVWGRGARPATVFTSLSASSLPSSRSTIRTSAPARASANPVAGTTRTSAPVASAAARTRARASRSPEARTTLAGIDTETLRFHHL